MGNSYVPLIWILEPEIETVEKKEKRNRHRFINVVTKGRIVYLNAS